MKELARDKICKALRQLPDRLSTYRSNLISQFLTR